MMIITIKFIRASTKLSKFTKIRINWGENKNIRKESSSCLYQSQDMRLLAWTRKRAGERKQAI